MLNMLQKKRMPSLFVDRLTSGSSEGKTADFVQRLGEKAETGEYELPEDDGDVAKEMAMKSFLRAMDRKDAKGMVAALTDFMYLCEGSEPEVME